MAEPTEKINNDSSSGEYDSQTQVGEHDARNHSFAHSGRHGSITAAERARRNANAKLANPLAGYSHAELRTKGANYVKKYAIGDAEDVRAFEIGACLAQDPARYDAIEGITGEELEVLKKEFTNRWSQPKLMYVVIVLCSTCAAVQGMGRSPHDEDVYLLLN